MKSSVSECQTRENQEPDMRNTAHLLLALIFASVMSQPARSQTGQPHLADAPLAHATAFQAALFGYPVQGIDQRVTEEGLTHAPREPFYMVLRLYGPGKATLDGRWTPPAVERMN
jgi:hypothetical protein